MICFSTFYQCAIVLTLVENSKSFVYLCQSWYQPIDKGSYNSTDSEIQICLLCTIGFSNSLLGQYTEVHVLVRHITDTTKQSNENEVE